MTSDSRVIRTTNILSTMLVCIIAISFPAIYFSLAYAQLASILDTEAEAASETVGQMISRNPLFWKYESIRMDELLSKRPCVGEKETRRIFDRSNSVIAVNDDGLSPPLLSRDHPLFDSGTVVGRLEISRSLRGLIVNSIYLAVGGAIFGGILFAYLRLYPLKALGEAVAGLNELNRTLKERVEEEVARGREKDHLLIQQSKLASMGEMMGNIAHQWRQPLNAVGLILQDLRDAYRLGELSTEYLDKSVDKAMSLMKHMSSTIDDFRNYFSPEKEAGSFSIVKAVFKAASFVEASLKNSGIMLELDLKEDITTNGFQNEYVQVLLNLLGNSRDILIERRSPNPKIFIGAYKKEEGGSVVVIRDNAGGIPGNIIDRIFDPYFSSREDGKGTGIGLYMSKMMIEKNMSGKLTASNTSEGAEFRVEV